ncbi:MAG: PAS domain S-box protein [Alphaproteobacteria bacterium]|nr:PAS domain S-box protein [Alphaproteobacteria bacterium]
MDKADDNRLPETSAGDAPNALADFTPAELGALVDLGGDVIWRLDAELRVTLLLYRPRPGGRWLRSMPAEGGLITDFVPPGPRGEARAADLREILLRRETFNHFVHRLLIADWDARRVVMSAGAPRHDSEGRFAGYQGISKDLTAPIAELRDREIEDLLAASAPDPFATEARLKDYAAAGADWYWEMDAQLRFTYISESVERFTGKSRLGAYGLTGETFLRDDHDPEQWVSLQRTLQAHEPFRDFEYRAGSRGIDPPDKVLWCRISGTPVLDEAGNFKGYRGTGRDITELRLAQEKVRRAERQMTEEEERTRAAVNLRQLIENSQDVISVVDGQGIVQYISPSVETITGLQADTVIGADVFSLIHRDDLRRVRAAFEQGVKDGGSETVIYRSRHLDDRWITLETTGKRVVAGGQIRLVLNSRDVTSRIEAELALRESEGRFRAITEGTPVPLLITRRSDGVVLYANEKAGPALGLDTAELIGRPVQDFFWQPESREERAEKVDTAQLIQEAPLDMRRADGRLIRTIHSLQAITYRGEPAILGCFQDVTEQVNLAEQLRQAQKMEAVGQLTGGVAHDFNNLLAVILGNAELLSELVTEADAARWGPLDAVLRSATRGAELTKRLLAFSRRQSLAPRAIRLDREINSVVEMLQRTLGENIAVKTAHAADPWHCLADPGQVENALLNLAINARDAMPQGGELRIETANTHLDEKFVASIPDLQPGQYVVLTVGDTGAGMSLEVLEHVLEPFYTTKAQGEGTGLGLSMVYGFAKQSGGHLSIASELDRGTTVKLYLPRTEPEAREGTAAVEREISGEMETVLVVEDDADVRELTVSHLDTLGYEVLAAADGGQALSILKNVDDIHLLLTDVVLPGDLNGIELARAAAQVRPVLRVLYMSGYAEDAVLDQGRPSRDATLLQKPFRRTDLARKVREALDGTGGRA